MVELSLNSTKHLGDIRLCTTQYEEKALIWCCEFCTYFRSKLFRRIHSVIEHAYQCFLSANGYLMYTTTAYVVQNVFVYFSFLRWIENVNFLDTRGDTPKHEERKKNIIVTSLLCKLDFMYICMLCIQFSLRHNIPNTFYYVISVLNVLWIDHNYDVQGLSKIKSIGSLKIYGFCCAFL